MPIHMLTPAYQLLKIEGEAEVVDSIEPDLNADLEENAPTTGMNHPCTILLKRIFIAKPVSNYDTHALF